MPLLGKVLFSEPTKSHKTSGDEGAFKIPHTKEVFSSKEEYEDRVQLYNRRVWTCQCTGHINLTHEEAVESERKSRETLARSFPEIYEKPVLSVAHHSSDLLDKIVNKAYKLVHTQHFENEIVNFEPTPGKRFDAKVISVCSEPAEDDTAGKGSPSSDKENHSSKQSLITDMFKSATSPERERKSSGSSQEESPERTTEPANLKYNILLGTENKIIRGVPAKTISGVVRPPSRHNIRLFIRANAIRHEYKKLKAWIVDKSMVKKYGLVGRFSKEEEENFLRASSLQLNSFVGYSCHSRPLANGSSHHNGDSAQLNEKSVKGGESGDTSEPLRNIKPLPKQPSTPSTSDSKPIKLAPIFSPRGKSKKEKKDSNTASSSSVRSVDFNTLAKSEFHPKADKTKKGKSAIPEERKRKRKNKSQGELSPKKKMKTVLEGGTISDDDLPLSKLASSQPSLTTKSPGSGRKSSSPKKKKQATLLELTRKKGGMMLMTSTKSPALGSSPASSPKKPRAPRQPPIVYQLLRLKKEKKFQVHKYKKLLNDAARMLKEKQRKNLPDLVKQDILGKWEAIERKRKWESMTPEERKQMRAEERVKKNKKFEDVDIVSVGKVKPLPSLELAPTSGGLPNTVFGDIAMVVEFMHAYRNVIAPRDSHRITHSALAEALAAGKQGYDSISRIMSLIFHMLLSDGIAQEYKELDFRIDSVPITPEVCSELARICLRQLDDDLDEEALEKSDDPIDEDPLKTTAAGISDEVFSKLLDNEMYELDADDQLEVLCALTYRLVNTYTAQAFREDAKERASEAYKKLSKLRIEDNLLKKEQKEKKKESKDKEQQSPPKPDKEENVPQEQESVDLVSRVKRRRLEAAERKQEEEEKRLKWEEEKKKLFDQQMKEAEHDKLLKQMKDTELTATRAHRLQPLGTDRNHSRYWLFSDCTPGLYVEKGWVQDYINYTTQSAASNNTTDDTGSPVSEDEIPLSLLGSPSQAGRKVSSKEVTVPHVGQNLWFVIETKETLDEILSRLCSKGIRESHLKAVIEKKYNHILRSITKYQATLPKAPDVPEEGARPTTPPVTRKSNVAKDAEEDARKSLRKRLQTIVHDISRGSLGDIQDEYEVFVARIDSAQDVGDFSSLLIDIFNAVDMRFFREYMSGITQKKRAKREDLLPFEEAEKLENPKKLAKAEKRRERWVKAVEGATHYSRLSFLLTILHSSVMWEMFKYCRTSRQRASARNKNYAEMVDPPEEEGEEEEEEEEEEENEPPTRRSTRYRTRGDNNIVSQGLRSGRRLRNRVIEEEEEDEEDAEEEESEKNEDDSSDEEDDESQEEEDDSQEESQEEEESEEEEEDEEKENLERCLAVMNRLLQYKCSSLFRYPVEEESVPDYYEVIENPMSLSEIKDTIEKASGVEVNTSSNSTGSRTRSADRPREKPPAYTPDQLLEDVRLVLDNAEMYNGHESFVWRQALKLKSAFVRCFMENFRHSVRLTKRLNRLFDTETD